MHSFIVSRLHGGLGNQLFQYAAGRALAKRLGVSLVLDPTLLPLRDLPRSYELAPYRLPATILAAPLRNALRVALKLRLWPSYDERHFHYDERLFTVRPRTVIQGWWQSERYFESIADELRRALRDDFLLSPAAQEMAKEIAAAPHPVSVHVRRTDFADDPKTSLRHGVCSESYYADAIGIVAREGVPACFVFTDDPEWVRGNMQFPAGATLVSGRGGLTHHDELALMSHCRSHVIANSSFSWWGAWLDPDPRKIVVAPRPWFGHDDYDTRDLLPKEWIVIARN